MWAVGFALFVLGIVFLISYPISKRKNARCSAQTEGVLSDSIRTRNSNGDIRRTYVYSYRVDGIDYQIKSTALNPDVSEIGDSCTIWYNPKKPKDAQPFHYESNRVYRTILIVGIVLTLLGIILTMAGLAL